jgi:hypothetical protein
MLMRRLRSSRHPDQVKAAVLIDVNLACFFTDEPLDSIRSSDAQLQSTGGRTSPDTTSRLTRNRWLARCGT